MLVVVLAVCEYKRPQQLRSQGLEPTLDNPKQKQHGRQPFTHAAMSQQVSPILEKLEASLSQQGSPLEHIKALHTLLVEKPSIAVRGAGNDRNDNM